MKFKVSILFLSIFITTLYAHLDRDYIYQNQKDISIDISIKDDSHRSVKVTRSDGKILLDSKREDFYIDNSNGALDISYRLLKAPGGFDVLYIVKNSTKRAHLMPDFQIPGVRVFEDKYIEILNTNTKQHMQKRYLSTLSNSSDGEYFSVSSIIQEGYDGEVFEEEFYYGADTLSAYSPVIALKGSDFAVGTSLNYPILDYIDSTKTLRGYRNVLMNKLYPKMRVYRDKDGWIFKYIFSKQGALKARIESGKSYSFTIPVRFSSPKYWLLTLYPYKEYFQKLYPKDKKLTKDLRPILLSIFSFYGDNVTDKNPRGWSWALENIDKRGYSYLPLKDVISGLSAVMKKRGYSRILFSAFSGVYDTREDNSLYNELPFQFLTNLPKNMQQELNTSLDILKSNSQEFGFWWGTSSMIPVNKDGDVISKNRWQPDNNTPFIYEDESHKDYAYRELNMANTLGVDSLSLDAYVRMEESGRVRWLDEMKEASPNIEFALEQQVDFMHTKAAIILQPELALFEKSNPKKALLTKPPIFSNYINPDVEIQVWVREFDDKKVAREYIKSLIRWGYTPIVMMPNGSSFDHNQRDLKKRILQQADEFILVDGFENLKVVACFDGVDNDGDGDVDWPYDKGCESASDDTESFN